MMNKHNIRQQLRTKRQALSSSQTNHNSTQICQRIVANYLTDINLHIGIYLPFGNEVNLKSLSQHHPKLYIPSVQGKNMQFQPWTQTTTINTHPLGMQQPTFDTELRRTHLDICFLPLLGFDNQGNRLGMGGGFYDRYFENISDTLLIGVGHDCQQVDALPHDDWDVKLEGIVTESQHLNFQKQTNTT